MEIRRIGLIAGNGRLPFLFARAARVQGIEVVAVAVRGDASPLLCPFVTRMKWFAIGQVREGLAYFHEQGVKQVIMAGQVSQRNLFNGAISSDDELKKFFAALQDRKADTIFRAVTELLANNGLEVLDSTLLLKAFLAPAGTLTKRGPTPQELADIEFGRTIAKAMGGLDVGQTVVVKQKAIVAIEAMEGTDRCIARGGIIAREGAVVVKTSKPHQDARFDVPVIGPRTIAVMAKAKSSCLGIEAEKTLILDREKCIRMANHAGICIVSA